MVRAPALFRSRTSADNDKALSWLPIQDEDQINQFCADFGVNRPRNKPGTSIVIVMPSEELLYNGKLGKLAVSLLANYLRPVSEGKMTLKVAELPAIGKHNLRTGMNDLRDYWGLFGKNLRKRTWQPE